MSDQGQWLKSLGGAGSGPDVDGLVLVKGYSKHDRPPDEVAVVEKAQNTVPRPYSSKRAGMAGRPWPRPSSSFPTDGLTTRALLSCTGVCGVGGGVPLVYRVAAGLVQLFRCAHKADFESQGEVVFKPYKTLKLAGQIANDPWWDAERLRNGTLWDNPKVCKTLLSGRQAAQKTLIKEVKLLHDDLDEKGILPKPLRENCSSSRY